MKTQKEKNQNLDVKSKKGIERVNKLLNATAKIIVSEGIDALSVKRITEESKTSASSFYHFFPNIMSLIDMLHQNHALYIKKLIDELNKNFTPMVWYKKNTTDFVHDLFGPFAEYLMKNKDYLIEVNNRNKTFEDSGFHFFLKKVLWAKYPNWAECKINKESDILYALAIGMLMQIYMQKENKAYDYIPDILKVIVIYLNATNNEVDDIKY